MSKYILYSNPYKSLNDSLLQNLNDIQAIIVLGTATSSTPLDVYEKYYTKGRYNPFRNPNHEVDRMWENLIILRNKFITGKEKELSNSRTLSEVREFLQYILSRANDPLPIFYAKNEEHPYFNIKALLNDLVNEEYDDEIAYNEFLEFSYSLIKICEKRRQ